MNTDILTSHFYEALIVISYNIMLHDIQYLRVVAALYSYK